MIDHVNNDGYEHRKKIPAGMIFYKWLIDNDYPSSMQLLCANCNYGKRLNKGECPHKTRAIHNIEIVEIIR